MVRDFQDDGPQDAAVHWTDRSLTFNTSCHDCHVSQLEKNYNPEDDSYNTTWKEPGINCEVCHGPAEAHVKAAEEAAAKGEELKDLKLIRFHEDLNREQRDATCGPCHAKGQILTRDFTPGELFFNQARGAKPEADMALRCLCLLPISIWSSSAAPINISLGAAYPNAGDLGIQGLRGLTCLHLAVADINSNPNVLPG